MATPIFKDYANGVRDVKKGNFYPFKTKALSGPGNVLEPAPNRRYYIHAIQVSLAAVAGDAGTSVTITGKQDLADTTLAEILHTTLTASERTATFYPGVLLDPESAMTATGPNLTGVNTWVKYCEVDEFANPDA